MGSPSPSATARQAQSIAVPCRRVAIALHRVDRIRRVVMSRFYVVGGRQKPGVTAKTNEWHHYSAGIIVSVDPEGSIHTCVEHVTPPEACASAHNPSILFK